MLQCVRGIKCKQCQGREEKRTKCTRNNYTATRVLKQKPQGVCAIMVQPSKKRFLVKKVSGKRGAKVSRRADFQNRVLLEDEASYSKFYYNLFFHKELLLVSVYYDCRDTLYADKTSFFFLQESEHDFYVIYVKADRINLNSFNVKLMTLWRVR